MKLIKYIFIVIGWACMAVVIISAVYYTDEEMLQVDFGHVHIYYNDYVGGLHILKLEGWLIYRPL